MTITETFDELLDQYENGNKGHFFNEFQQLQDGDRHSFLIWLRDNERADILCSIAVRLI